VAVADIARATIETAKLEGFVEERGSELTVSLQAIVNG